MIGLVTALPNTVIRDAISRFDVEDQVLDERDLKEEELRLFIRAETENLSHTSSSEKTI